MIKATEGKTRRDKEKSALNYLAALAMLATYLAFFDYGVRYLIIHPEITGVPYQPSLLVTLFYGVGVTSALALSIGAPLTLSAMFFAFKGTTNWAASAKNKLACASLLQLGLSSIAATAFMVWKAYSPIISGFVQFPTETIIALKISLVFKLFELSVNLFS